MFHPVGYGRGTVDKGLPAVVQLYEGSFFATFRFFYVFYHIAFFPCMAGTGGRSGKPVIRVVFDKSLSPLSYLDENEQACGFDIELIRHGLELRGYQIKYVPLEWGDAVQQLKTGQLDVVVGMKYTSTRDTLFDFSDAYLTMSDALVVPSGNRDIAGINNLRGKVVAVQREDNGITQLDSIRRVRRGKILAAFSQPDAMDMLF